MISGSAALEDIKKQPKVSFIQSNLYRTVGGNTDDSKTLKSLIVSDEKNCITSASLDKLVGKTYELIMSSKTQYQKKQFEEFYDFLDQYF